MNKIYLEDFELDEEILVLDVETREHEIMTVEDALELDGNRYEFNAFEDDLWIDLDDVLQAGIAKNLEDEGFYDEDDVAEEITKDIMSYLYDLKVAWLIQDKLEEILTKYRRTYQIFSKNKNE